jgi:hypothetical protein
MEAEGESDGDVVEIGEADSNKVRRGRRRLEVGGKATGGVTGAKRGEKEWRQGEESRSGE